MYKVETPLVTGPLLDVQAVMLPLGSRIQVGVPVGGSEPVAPVIVAVKVVI